MPMIQNSKGTQFWSEVNRRLEAVGHSVDEIHYICPELAISTLKKWQAKGALPASEHICLIKTALESWEDEKPAQVNEIQQGENPMVMDTTELEKVKAELEDFRNRNRAYGKKLWWANKRIKDLGGKPVDDDYVPESNNAGEFVELQRLAQETQERELHYKAERDELQNKVDELERKLDAATHNLDVCATSNEELSNSLKEANISLQSADEAIDSKNELIAKLQDDVEKHKSIAKEYVDELEERNQVIDVYEKEKQMLMQRVAQLSNGSTATKPSYYHKGGIECKDLIKIMLEDVSGIEAFNLGNALKYLWRWQGKNGAEDIAKAITYLEELRNGIIDKTTAES